MKKIYTLLLSALIVSCGPSQQEYNTLLDQNKKLEVEVANLKAELEAYKNTPDRLYYTVPELVKNKNIDSLTVVCKKLEKYHPTSDEYQKAQSALKKLIDEREKMVKAEQAKRMQAVYKLKKEYDDVRGVTWYYNPYFTHYNNTNFMSLYIGQTKADGRVWLRLKMSYEGDNWIFFENAYLSYDENTRPIIFSKKETDVGYGGQVWEWIDVSVDNELLAYLKDFANGKSLKMMLSGKYSKTRKISNTERNAIKDVLLAYDVLTKGE